MGKKADVALAGVKAGSRARLSLIAGAIVGATLLVYLPALNARFIWDDPSYVTQNKRLRDVEGLRLIWTEPRTADPLSMPQYYPLVLSSFWVEYQLCQLRPFIYHFNNVLLHALGAFLLYLTLRRLRAPGAFLAAMLFAAHPVFVESVAWVTERKNVLSGVFYLAALLSYLKYEPVGLPAAGGRKTRGRSLFYYFLALTLFVCALLSKTVTASLPAAIIVICWWKSPRFNWRAIPPLIPFFIIGILLARQTAALEREHIGAVGGEWALNPLERVILAGQLVWHYAMKLVWPAHLSFMYHRWEVSQASWGQYLFPLAAVGLLALLYLARKRIGKGALAAALLFEGTLFPALGFFNVFPMRFSYAADHFQYHAAIAPLALGAAAATLLLARFRNVIGRIAIAALAWCSFAAMAFMNNYAFHDVHSLWRDTIRKTPSSWMAYNHLGLVLRDKGYHASALASLDMALQWREATPALISDDLARLDIAKIHSARASIYLGQMDYTEALRECDAALVGKYPNPDAYLYRARAHFGIASETADPEQIRTSLISAREDYRDMMKLLGPYAAASDYWELASCNMYLGYLEDAKRDFAEVIARDPLHYEALMHLGEINLRQGKYGEAVGWFSRVIKVAPNSSAAYGGRAACFSALGEYEKAAADFAISERFANLGQ